jgi:hypothetical protein
MKKKQKVLVVSAVVILFAVCVFALQSKAAAKYVCNFVVSQSCH